MTTLATGALEAGVPLFLADNLGLNAAWIGAVLLVMVVAQGLGGWMWGYQIEMVSVRYMIFGWCLVTISLVAAGYVAHSISDKTLAAYTDYCFTGDVPIRNISSSSTNVANNRHCYLPSIWQRRSRVGIWCIRYSMGCRDNNPPLVIVSLFLITLIPGELH